MPKDDGMELLLDKAEGILYKLFMGEVELWYDDALHLYYVIENGDRILVPGVTTVIAAAVDKSAPLMQWAVNECLKSLSAEIKSMDPEDMGYVKDDPEGFTVKHKFAYKKVVAEASNVGSVAHDWLENWVKIRIAGYDVVPELPENLKAQSCIQAALSWFKIHDFQPISSERKIYSRVYGYTGTLDIVGYITYKGVRMRVILDFKSANGIYESNRLQLAAYQQAWEEEFPEQTIDARVLLRLGKEDGEFEALILLRDLDYERDLTAFVCALGVYCWSKELSLEKKEHAKLVKLQKQAAKPPKKVKLKKAENPQLMPVGD